jgi:hypothetical protein
MFILITPDEDGNHMRIFSTEAELAEDLDDAYGEDTRSSVIFKDTEFLKNNPDPNYWRSGEQWVDIAVLLKGEVIVPKAVEVVKRWEV